jgi:dTDP-4-amino-4,6-dideoxygalactose transaminase
MEDGRYAGTIGHIGIFSLNYHKHIHTGEGGMCVTNDDELSLRLRLIRNHAENSAEPSGAKSLVNLVGFNYRMTELSAAVGIAQLRKSEHHVGRRERLGQRLTDGLQDIKGLIPPKTKPGCRHVYYVWAARIDDKVMGISRDHFTNALAAEGFPLFTGYVQPLYLLPLFQNRIAFGNSGYPFTLSDVTYKKGICPVVERMWEKEFFGFETCMYDVQEHEIDLLVQAVRKVHANRDALSRLDP